MHELHNRLKFAYPIPISQFRMNADQKIHLLQGEQKRTASDNTARDYNINVK